MCVVLIPAWNTSDSWLLSVVIKECAPWCKYSDHTWVQLMTLMLQLLFEPAFKRSYTALLLTHYSQLMEEWSVKPPEAVMPLDMITVQLFNDEVCSTHRPYSAKVGLVRRTMGNCALNCNRRLKVIKAFFSSSLPCALPQQLKAEGILQSCQSSQRLSLTELRLLPPRCLCMSGNLAAMSCCFSSNNMTG